MKKYVVKIICIGLAVFLLLTALLFVLPLGGLAVISCGNRMPDYDEVKAIFEQNRDVLLAAAADDTIGSLSLPGVKSVYDHMDDDERRFVEFTCGSYGMGGETGYTGFYYAPDDPFDYWCVPSDKSLLEPRDGGWYYKAEGDDNTVLILPLGDGFYYWLAEF